MWHRNRFIGVLCRGQKRDVVRQFYSNLQKRTQSRLVARIIQARITMIKNTETILLKGQAPTLSDTHSDKINPVEWQRTFAATEGGS